MEREPHSLEFETTLLNCGYVIHYTCNAPNQRDFRQKRNKINRIKL